MTGEIAAPSFSECDDATDDLPLRQGDILQWLTPQANTASSMGVVVTADCDIAQMKHNNTISYVPLYSLDRFLAMFVLPRKLERALSSVRDNIAKRATAFRKQQDSNVGTFSQAAIDVWVSSVDGDGIATALQVETGRRRDEFVGLIDAYKRARPAQDSTELRTIVQALVLLRTFQGATAEKALSNVWEEIDTSVKNLPGDAFFLASLGAANGLRNGYVAYLRILRELHPSNVALRVADLRSAEVTVKRVARLRSPYVYRLTQQLAAVFSSIGLPTAYELERGRIAAVLKADPENP